MAGDYNRKMAETLFNYCAFRLSMCWGIVMFDKSFLIAHSFQRA